MAFVFSTEVNAQNEVLDPVKWDYEVLAVDSNEITIKFKATIEEGWKVYSQFIKGDGPIPTSVNFDNEELQKNKLTATESGSNKVEELDELFDLHLVKFKDNLFLTQKINNIQNLKMITGHIEFMTCTNELCLFPEPYQFTINLKK